MKCSACLREGANREVTQKNHHLRQRAGFSQTVLSKRLGTIQSVISQLEDVDYGGHYLAMLNRIAAGVERRVEVRFMSKKRRLQPD